MAAGIAGREVGRGAVAALYLGVVAAGGKAQSNSASAGARADERSAGTVRVLVLVVGMYETRPRDWHSEWSTTEGGIRGGTPGLAPDWS